MLKLGQKAKSSINHQTTTYQHHIAMKMVLVHCIFCNLRTHLVWMVSCKHMSLILQRQRTPHFDLRMVLQNLHISHTWDVDRLPFRWKKQDRISPLKTRYEINHEFSPERFYLNLWKHHRNDAGGFVSIVDLCEHKTCHTLSISPNFHKYHYMRFDKYYSLHRKS